MTKAMPRASGAEAPGVPGGGGDDKAEPAHPKARVCRLFRCKRRPSLRMAAVDFSLRVLRTQPAFPDWLSALVIGIILP